MKLFILGVIIAVGMSMAFSDEEADRVVYCQMVAEGTWPAYDGECK